MAVRYSTNWMGVANLQWYRDRGLTRMVSRVMEQDSVLTDQFKAGDVIELEEITEHYSAGRIDVRGTDDPWGDEIGLPPMRSEDWNSFGAWLDTFETDHTWTLRELVELYEQTNAKIRWARPVDELGDAK